MIILDKVLENTESIYKKKNYHTLSYPVLSMTSYLTIIVKNDLKKGLLANICSVISASFLRHGPDIMGEDIETNDYFNHQNTHHYIGIYKWQFTNNSRSSYFQKNYLYIV